VEGPLSGAAPILPARNRGIHGRAVRQQRGQDDARSAAAMLSVPTLWMAFVINFFTMGMIWAYVVRSYPKLEAARFWTASALVAGLGAGIATLRVIVDSLTPFVAGGTVLVFAA